MINLEQIEKGDIVVLKEQGVKEVIEVMKLLNPFTMEPTVGILVDCGGVSRKARNEDIIEIKKIKV